jgi:glycosyltransferase involved in cell wall biosynthesis
MVIVHLISGLQLGGAELSLLRLIRGQRGRTTNRVIALRRGGPMRARLEEAGASVDEIEGDGLRESWRNWRAALREVRAHKPDIVHGWMYAGQVAAVAMRRWACPEAALIWNVRASLTGLATFPRRTRWSIELSRMLSGRADALVFNSHVGMSEHVAHGFDGRRGLVIANGYDTAQWRRDPAARARLRERLGIAEATIVVANVARFDPMKDHATLLRAVAALKDLNVHFLLVGPGVSADNPFFADHVRDLGLDGRVSLLGERRDVVDLLSASDLFCLSSYTEGLPNAVAEAMACALPCVSTDVGDVAQLVGDTGRVVPPRDPAALAAALRALIEAGNDERASLGEGARRRIVEQFDLTRMVADYDSLYARFAG